MNTKFKAIAPIITTILLVVVAVILVAIFLSFSKGFTNDSLDKTTEIKDISSSDAEYFVYPKTFSQGVIQFNYSPPANLVTENITITSYKIFADNNETIDVNLDTNHTLVNGSNIINLTDFSEFEITSNK